MAGTPAAGGDLTQLDALLKNTYGDYLQNLEKESLPLRLLEKVTDGFEGRQFHDAVDLQRGWPVGGRGERETLPLKNANTVKNSTVTVKPQTLTVEVTQELIDKMQGNPGAFARGLETAMSQAREAFRVHLSKHVAGDGYSATGAATGRKMVLTATGATDAAFDAGGDAQVKFDTDHNVAVGMYVDIYNGSTKKVGNALVESLTSTEVKVNDDGTNTTGLPYTIQDNDELFLAGERGNAIHGLRAGADKGTIIATYMGINRSTYPEWAGNYTASLGDPISETVLDRHVDACRRRGGGDIDALLSSYAVRRPYLQTLQAQRQQIEVALKAGGNEKVAAYDGKPWYASPDVRAGSLFGLQLGSWALMEQTPFGWVRNQDSLLNRQGRTLVYEIYGRWTIEVYCRNPKANFLIEGATSDTVV